MSEIMEMLYDSYETSPLHEMLESVQYAEALFKELYTEIKELSQELAARADEITGIISRAYSKQGFCLGMKVMHIQNDLRKNTGIVKSSSK